MSDSTVEFSVLCSMFDGVVRAKKGPVKRKHLRTFLDRVYTDHEFFSALRLMLPSLDKERGNYGLKETVLGKFLAEALCLSKDSSDAQKLLNWRKGGTRAGSNAGNFAFIATEILYSRQRVTSLGLKIKDVNDLLDRLAAANKREEKVAVLADMINKTNAQEMRWIIMIVLKDLKLGISEKTVFSEFHPDAEDLFNVTCDLKLVCEKLRDRNARYNRQDIEVGKAVRPQLAARVANVEEAWKKFRGKQVTVECKFDGDRIQIHKDGTKLWFFSRNFNDHQQFKEGMADVLVQNILPDKCILDGEMLVWDQSSNRFADFGTNREAAKAAREGLETSQQLCYVAFDLLYHGNSSVIHLPLRERQEVLYKAVRPVKGRLELLLPNGGLSNHRSSGEPMWSITASSAEEIERFFQDTVENREEGIILKDLDSKWEPSDRSGKWLKLKPDYIHTGSDLDVLIIGGYFGSGRRGGQVAQFLLGIADKHKAGEYPTRFLSFCKVGSGLSDEECDHLVQKLKPYFRRNEKNSKPPSCYIVTNNAKERPDVWIDQPDKSVILEIMSDIRTINTNVFAAPHGLRFPRVHRVRYEKPWYDCLDVQGLLDLVNSRDGTAVDVRQYGTLEKKPKQSKRAKKADVNILPLVPSHMCVTDVSRVKRTTQIFTDLIFYFANSPEEHSRETLHKLVVENGGSFSMNLNDDVTHAIASERKGIKFQASAAHGDVIHFSWIIDCCTSKALLPVRPKYFLHLSNQTKEKMKADIDDYGDYYFVDIDTKDLSQLFESIDPAKLATDCDELKHYQRKYCPSSTFCQFTDCHFYFSKPIHSSNPDSQVVAEIALKRQELEVSMHAAAVSERLNGDVTHMIVYTSAEQPLPFRTIFKSISPRERRFIMSDKLKILSHQWIDDHVLGTCGHPSEANYCLREASFQYNGQEVDMGSPIEASEKHDDGDRIGDTKKTKCSKEYMTDIAESSEFARKQDVNHGHREVKKIRGGKKGRTDRAEISVLPRKTDARDEHGDIKIAGGSKKRTADTAEVSDLARKKDVSGRLEDIRKTRGSKKRSADVAEVSEFHRNRLVTLEKLPKERKQPRDNETIKMEEVVTGPSVGRAVKSIPSSRGKVKEEFTSTDMAKAELELAPEEQKIAANRDDNSSCQATGVANLSSREDDAAALQNKRSRQETIDISLEALMGDLLPSLNSSPRLPLIQTGGVIREKQSFVPAPAEASSVRNIVTLSKSKNISDPNVIERATNPTCKKKVSYKTLVGDLLKPS